VKGAISASIAAAPRNAFAAGRTRHFLFDAIVIADMPSPGEK
jgi:hypothetical protein